MDGIFVYLKAVSSRMSTLMRPLHQPHRRYSSKTHQNIFRYQRFLWLLRSFFSCGFERQPRCFPDGKNLAASITSEGVRSQAFGPNGTLRHEGCGFNMPCYHRDGDIFLGVTHSSVSKLRGFLSKSNDTPAKPVYLLLILITQVVHRNQQF